MHAKHYLQWAKKLVHIGLIFSWVAGYTSGNKAKPLEIQYKAYIPIFVCAKYHKFILCLSISTFFILFYYLASSSNGAALSPAPRALPLTVLLRKTYPGQGIELPFWPLVPSHYRRSCALSRVLVASYAWGNPLTGMICLLETPMLNNRHRSGYSSQVPFW